MTEKPTDLPEKWRGYYDTSKAAMLAAQDAGNPFEAESRRAEACTLNVCILDLTAALSAQGAPQAERATELRQIADRIVRFGDGLDFENARLYAIAADLESLAGKPK